LNGTCKMLINGIYYNIFNAVNCQFVQELVGIIDHDKFKHNKHIEKTRKKDNNKFEA